MKRIGYLFERVVSFSNLWRAAHKAWRGKRKKTRVATFFFHLENELLALQSELISGLYQPRPYRTFEVFEPKHRQIAAADFRDRVVHHAIINHLEPVFEKSLIPDTYACRLGKGTHVAVKRAQFFSKRHPFFLKCDIRKYFASIDHNVLKALLWCHIKDYRLLDLLELIIDHPLPNGPLGRGVAIGNLTSQHFANLYLGELDHFVQDCLAVPGYIRYMDDFIFFGPSKSFLHDVHFEVRHFLEEFLTLELKSRATILSPVVEGIPFLGFRVYPGTIRLQGRSRSRFVRQLRNRQQAFLAGEIDERLLSGSVGSMIAHMAHADTRTLRQCLFSDSMGLG